MKKGKERRKERKKRGKKEGTEQKRRICSYIFHF